jgi:hypothetical protein
VLARVRVIVDLQSRSLLTLSTAFPFPFSLSFIRRMESSIALKSSPAFFARSSDFCLSSLSSSCSNLSSSVGGTASGWFLYRAERIVGGELYADSLGNMVCWNGVGATTANYDWL